MPCNVRKETRCYSDKKKMCNPKTSRCVDRYGKVGKKLPLNLNLVNIERLKEMASDYEIPNRSYMDKENLVNALTAYGADLPPTGRRPRGWPKPTRPSRPPSAYNLFVKKELRGIMDSQKVSAPEAMKLIGALWRAKEGTCASPKKKSPAKRKSRAKTCAAPTRRSTRARCGPKPFSFATGS